MGQWGRYDLWVGPRHSMDSELWPCSSSSPRTRMRFCPYQFLLSCPAVRWGLIRSLCSVASSSLHYCSRNRRDSSIRRWAFYKRRIVRLLPPLFFLLVANVIFAVVTNSWSRQNLDSLLSVVFYYSNYYQAHSPNVFCANLSQGYEHLWSLSFEEQFYLIWPWLVIAFLTVRRSLRTVVIVILGTIVIVGIHRGLAYQGVQSWCYEFRCHKTGATPCCGAASPLTSGCDAASRRNSSRSSSGLPQSS